MSSWKNAVVTQKGLNLQAKLVDGNSLKITKVVAGAGYVSPGLLQQQTAVNNIKGVLLIKTIKYPSPGVCAIRVALSNAGVTSEYTACQIGIYAEDPDEGEILYFIAQAESTSDGVDVSTEADVPSYAAEWEFYFKYGNANGVNVTVSPANTVSRQEMEEFHDDTIGAATQDALGDKADIPAAKHGKIISAAETADAPLYALSVHGKSTQNSTTGVQLFDFDAWANSVFLMKGTKEVTGNKIKLTATGDDCYTAYASDQFPIAARVPVIPGENYVLSWETDSESAAKNETYVFFDGLTAGMKTVNAAIKQIAFAVPAGITFVTFRFGVRAMGDSASFWDIMVNSGFEKTAYEPYTGRKPSPSPEYTQSIKSVGDPGSVMLSVLGANLLDYSKWSKSTIQGGVGEFKDNGVTITAGDAGDAYTQYSASYSRIPCVPGVKYVLSWEHTGALGLVYIFPNGSTTNMVNTSTAKGSSLEYTPEDGVEYFTFRFGCQTANTTATYKNIRINIEKDAGYTPYRAIQTMSIDTSLGLRGIPDVAGGNYIDETGQQWICDEVDLDRGVYVQRTHILQLTGNETINRPDNSGWAEGCYAVYPSKNPEHKHAAMLCTFLRGCSNAELAGNMYTSGIGTHGTSGLLVRFGAEVNTLELAKAAWKAAIEAGGKVIVPLLEPVEIQLTATEIAAFKAMQTYEGGTTIYNNAGAGMTAMYYTPHSALPRTGGHMSGPIDMGGNKITGLADPTEDGDAVSRGYGKNAYVPKGGGDVTGWLQFVGSTIGATWTTADGTKFQIRPYTPGNILQIISETASGAVEAINISSDGTVSLGNTDTKSPLKIRHSSNPGLDLQSSDGASWGGMFCSSNRVPTVRSYGSNGTNFYSYSFPGAPSDLSATEYFHLLTSKNAVKIAEGGTGATTAAQALANLGAAPAGYGLGVGNGGDCFDCNAAVNIGWYILRGTDTLNGPDGYLYCPMRVERRYYNVIQTVLGGATNLVRKGSSADGGKTWTFDEWEYDNPPLTAGTEYRTVERYNGKVVFAKCVYHRNTSAYGAMDGITEVSFAHGISGYGALVRVEAKQNVNFPLPTITSTGGSASVARVDASNVYLRFANTAFDARDWYIVIYYTK